MGSTPHCPLKFRDYDVFGTSHKQLKSVHFDLAATSELFLTKCCRLTEYKVDLPACVQVDDIEQRFVSMGLDRGLDFGVIALAFQILDKNSQFFWSGRYHNVDVLRRTRRAVASARKRTYQHVLHASVLKCCCDMLKNLCDAHFRPAGRGLGRKAILNSSRWICHSSQSGCSERIRSRAKSRANRLISNARRIRCSPDMER